MPRLRATLECHGFGTLSGTEGFYGHGFGTLSGTEGFYVDPASDVFLERMGIKAKGVDPKLFFCCFFLKGWG